jgi:hypothetical protein
MQAILQWPPLIWTLRIILLATLLAGGTIFLLLAARFFRWTHVKTLLRAELPRVRSVGGEFAGTKATVQLVQEKEEIELAKLSERVDNLQHTMDVALAALGQQKRRRR